MNVEERLPVRPAVRARRVLLVLTWTRWFPVGLVIGLTTLLPLQRGLSLTQVGMIMAVQGFAVLALELPTGGLADALGRRPVLLLAALIGLASWLIFIQAHSFATFLLAGALQGVYRALDSGPLEAWYVDTAQLAGESRVDRTLAQAGTVLGVAIASGALLSGGLIAWHPVPQSSPLVLPYWVAVGFSTAHLIGNGWLVREPRGSERGWRPVINSVRQAPGVVLAGVRLLRDARVLRCLVAVELFWSLAMIAFESLNPIRLAELTGSEDRAGALIGPVSSASWAVFAVGALLAGLLSRRIGVAWTAVLARVLNGLFVMIMGLATGPTGLIVAFLITYGLHGAAGPMHNTLLHRQAEPRNRATVLSMNSMISGGTMTIGALGLTFLAQYVGTAVAMIIAGALSVAGALLYRPALLAERDAVRKDPDRSPSSTDERSGDPAG